MRKQERRWKDNECRRAARFIELLFQPLQLLLKWAAGAVYFALAPVIDDQELRRTDRQRIIPGQTLCRIVAGSPRFAGAFEYKLAQVRERVFARSACNVEDLNAWIGTPSQRRKISPTLIHPICNQTVGDCLRPHLIWVVLIRVHD